MLTVEPQAAPSTLSASCLLGSFHRSHGVQSEPSFGLSRFGPPVVLLSLGRSWESVVQASALCQEIAGPLPLQGWEGAGLLPWLQVHSCD